MHQRNNKIVIAHIALIDFEYRSFSSAKSARLDWLASVPVKTLHLCRHFLEDKSCRFRIEVLAR